LKVIKCSKCSEELCIAEDSGKEEVVQFKVECPCGKENVELFLGYPKLCGIDKYYFEFVDQYKIVCKERHVNTRKKNG
jgi:hypothetical protein